MEWPLLATDLHGFVLHVTLFAMVILLFLRDSLLCVDPDCIDAVVALTRLLVHLCGVDLVVQDPVQTHNSR